MEKYVEMKERHQKMVDSLPLKFAFRNEIRKGVLND